MAIVSTPQTVRLSGSLTVEPAVPIVGGTESAVAISEALSAKSVSEQVFTLAASGSQLLTTTTLLNSDAAFLFIQATDQITVTDHPSASFLKATGTFIVISRTNNTYPNGLMVANNSSTSTVTVRVVLGALA
jgi:hypothetical protein